MQAWAIDGFVKLPDRVGCGSQWFAEWRHAVIDEPGFALLGRLSLWDNHGRQSRHVPISARRRWGAIIAVYRAELQI